MEYIVSARKYRPVSFDAVVGQQALTKTLKNAVTSGKLAHAYLFCGPRGVGKTTCARIFAKVINCTSPKTDGDACGECESCKAFEEQRSLNIFELDAASNNGVEHIKTLMDQTRVPPQVGKYKVFIIDEVHMLSSQAFNAFLKTLEEPPSYVVFILATTEKHKILPTILSRCQVYDFERMTVPNIIGHLKRVAEDQGITYEENALGLIAQKADGGMRDALSIFDQVASYSQGDITYQKVVDDLNVLDEENYFKAVDLALQNNVPEEMVLLNNVMERGFDAGHFISGLAGHIRNVLMARDANTLPLIETSDDMRKKYGEQAQKCNVKFLYEALRILNDCDVNYRQSSNRRLLVELTLIEIAQITQEDDAAGVGRGPRKKLKSLFKKLMSQVQSGSAVQQVAATGQSTVLRDTGHAAQVHAASGETVSNPANENGSVTPKPAGPRIKLGTVGMTFGAVAGINRTANVNTETEKNDGGPKENEAFTVNDLRLQWHAMCNRMATTEQVGMAKRLKNIVPSITDFPNIELLVENEMLRDELKNIRGRLEETMRKHLHNGYITFTIRLAEATERQKFLTPKENFEEMMKEYEFLPELVSGLGLELE